MRRTQGLDTTTSSLSLRLALLKRNERGIRDIQIVHSSPRDGEAFLVLEATAGDHLATRSGEALRSMPGVACCLFPAHSPALGCCLDCMVKRKGGVGSKEVGAQQLYILLNKTATPLSTLGLTNGYQDCGHDQRTCTADWP